MFKFPARSIFAPAARLPATLAVPPMFAALTTISELTFATSDAAIFAVARLPTAALAETVSVALVRLPEVATLPTEILPPTVSTFATESNVSAADAPEFPLLLN